MSLGLLASGARILNYATGHLYETRDVDKTNWWDVRIYSCVLRVVDIGN
jgi:hypothetical protein